MTLTRRGLFAAAGAGLLGAAGAPIGFGFRLYGMKSLPAHDALQVLADIGYDGAELELRPGWGTEPPSLDAAARRALRDRFRDHGLALPAVNESLQLDADGAAHRANLDRLARGAELFHDIAGSGPALLETGLGGRSAEWDKARDRMAARLADWARAAERGNLVIAFKPHAGHAVDTPERALWLLQQSGSPRIRVAFDYSHFQVLGLTLPVTLAQLLPYTALVLAKDASGSAANFTRLLPGEGGVDYVDYLQRLSAGGYKGFVVVEVSQQIHSRAGYDPVDTARRCYANLAPAWGKARVDRPSRAPSPPRGAIGFGFRLYGMQALETAEALRTLAKIGYDGVELELRPGWKTEPKLLSAAARRELRKLLDGLGLDVPAVNESLALDVPDARHAANIERLHRAAELYEDLYPGRRPLLETTMGGRSAQWGQRRDYMAERLAAWAAAAAQHQMTIAVKAHVGSAVDRPERALWLLDRAGGPWVKAAYDYSHFQLLGLTLEETLAAMLPRTAIVHVKDARGGEAKHDFLLPGDGGTVDYADYFRRLGAGGYRGFVMVEVSAQIHRRPDYDPVAAAGRCYRNLAPAFERAGVRMIRR